MKFAITLAALASLAAATPLDASTSSCKPGTYSCTPDKTGWQVCDVNHKYVVSHHRPFFYMWDKVTDLSSKAAGVCPPGTSCVFYKKSASPYCVPPGFKFPQA